MNKLLTKIVGVSLGLALAVGTGVAVISNSSTSKPAYAIDYTDVHILDTTDTAVQTNNSTYGSTGTATVEGIEWTFTGNGKINPWRLGGKTAQSGDQPFYTGTAISDAITRIVVEFGSLSGVTANSFQMSVHGSAADAASGSNAIETHTGLSIGANETATIDLTSAQSGKFYRFVPNLTISATSNKYLQLKTVTLKKVKSSSDTYTVTYAANGATGTVPVDSTSYSDSNNTVTVLGNVGGPNNDGTDPLVKSGYTFNGWTHGTNTYSAGDTFTISSSLTLTAKWYKNDSISAKESSYEIYTDATLNLVNCVTVDGDGELSFTVPNVNYLTYDSETKTITADSTNTGGPLTITAHKGTASCIFTVTVVTRPSSGTFELFSGSLEEGDYVIYYSGYSLKAGISSNRFENVTVTPVNDEIVNPDVLSIWHIEASGDYWTLYNDETGKYAGGTTTKNQGALLDTVTDYAKWSCSSDSTSETYDFINYGRENGANDTGNKYLRQNGANGWACYSISTGDALSLYKLPQNRTITASRMTTGTVSASTGDTEWTLSGFTFEVQYNNVNEWFTIDNSLVTYEVSADVPTISADGALNVTVTGTYKTASQTSQTISATLTYINLHSIERLYSLDSNASCEVDGVYMGEVADGYIFMNGDYGILVYDKSHASALTVGSTYTLTGTLSIYKGLYELTDVTITSLSDSARLAKVETPVVYEVVGGETADKANRKTKLTGYVKSMTSTAQDANSTVVVNVNGSDITLYVKAAQATEKNMTALSDNMTENSGKTSDFVELEMEGFTSWYNGFQVSLTQVVVEDTDYSIYDFARSLLKETLSTCTGGDHDLTTNKSALVAIWSELSGASYYGKLTAQRKSDLASGTADSSIVVPNTSAGIDSMSDADALAAALYRYDFCTAKYNLTPFIAGRTLSVSFGNRIDFLTNTNDAAVVIIIVATLGFTTIGGYFLLRKKKEER